jgi:hypothetical protein
MNDTDPLLPFVRTASASGIADDFAVELLRQQGWSQRRALQAYATLYAERLGLTIPARGGRFEYARDAFTYLLTFISLAAWTCAVGRVFYELIDRWFPNGLATPYAQQNLMSTLHFELATIIVAFPVYVAANIIISRGLAAHPEAADSGVRKWLTSIALVIAALIALGDGIAFLNAFLAGDLTVRLGLRSLVLFVISGSVFAYYSTAMRGANSDA